MPVYNLIFHPITNYIVSFMKATISWKSKGFFNLIVLKSLQYHNYILQYCIMSLMYKQVKVLLANIITKFY